MIYVTHDQVEAMTLADKIVVLRAGVIEQIGAPMELYNKPANDFVAGFIGSPRMNMVPVKTAADAGWKGAKIAGAVKIGVRPEHLVRSTNGLEGVVYYVEHLGGQTLTHIKLPDNTDLTLVEAGEHNYKRGDKLKVEPKAKTMHAFDQGGKAIRK
jgi:ABC-type sugar transport system ATPase subunit